MAVDKNKIVAEATKLVQKGAIDKAIQAYQKILREDPKDVRVLLKVGELFQKKRDDKAAADAFKRVADTYAEQGFFLKSVAVYKQIVKLDPEDVRVNERLASLYQQLGLMSDAMAQLQLVAAGHEKAADVARLTDVLKRMVELDPDNIASSIKLGELHARAGQTAAALEHLERAAAYLKKQNRADEYLKVAERIASLQPQDVALARELANIHLAKGDTKRALAKLQLCFKADPRDADTLTLLAQAFRDLGQTSKTVSVLKELARVHEDAARAQEARSTWRRLQEIAPDDPDATDALGTATPPPVAPAAARAGRPQPAPPPFPRTPPTPPPLAPAAAPGGDSIPKLLAETDVYVKYGLHDKALDHLRKILAVDPQSPDAHEKARDVELAARRPAQAAEAGARAVRAALAKGLPERARDALARLRQLAPDHPQLAALEAAVGTTEEVALDDSDVEEVPILSPRTPSDHPSDDDALALAAARTDGDEVVDDEDGSELDAVPPDRPRRHDDALAGARARGGAADGHAEVDLSDELEEADFFVQQGLLDEAREALENLRAFYPRHEGVLARIAELGRKAAPAHAVPKAAPRAPAAARDERFDIARELADEIEATGGAAPAIDDFQYSVEDVFSQFKKGVEKTVRKEDSATHYDLGIAYKEMGLVDDAVHEFETALGGNDRKKEVDCLTMIGLCRLEQGRAKDAIEAFRKALASATLTRDAAKAVQYDLATAWEAAGDPEVALHYLQKVKAADARFRDVAARIAGLGGGPGRPPPATNGAGTRPPARPTVKPPPPAPPLGTGSKKNIGYL